MFSLQTTSKLRSQLHFQVKIIWVIECTKKSWFCTADFAGTVIYKNRLS